MLRQVLLWGLFFGTYLDPESCATLKWAIKEVIAYTIRLRSDQVFLINFPSVLQIGTKVNEVIRR